jgi:hypothetical protein
MTARATLQPHLSHSVVLAGDQFLGLRSQIPVIWSGAADKFVSIIKNGAGLAIGGFIVGMGLVWLVDGMRDRHIKAELPTSLIKDRLPKRIQTISDIKKVVVCGVGLGMLIAIGITGRLNIISNIVLPFLATGVVMGESVWRSRIDSVSQCLQLIDTTVDTDKELDLGTHINKLRGMSLAELELLGARIYEEFKECRQINLKRCDLTDSDVQRLARAGWFSKFCGINLSYNAKLTVRTLNYISQKTFAGSKNSIFSINLSKTNLTDDGLKLMTESGIFAQVSELIIRDNPLISGQGLAYIGEHAKNLCSLDIGRNPQLLKEKEVDKWINKPGFNALKGFRVYFTEMTTKVFERLLDKTSWFKQLTGLDIRHNPALHISSRISELKKLSECSPTRCHNAYHFDNAGLYCTGCVVSSAALELKALMDDCKARLCSNPMPYNETARTREELVQLFEKKSSERDS